MGPTVLNSPAIVAHSCVGCSIKRRARASHAGSLRGVRDLAAGLTVGRGGGPALGGGPAFGGVGPRGGCVGPRGGGAPPGGRGGGGGVGPRGGGRGRGGGRSHATR